MPGYIDVEAPGLIRDPGNGNLANMQFLKALKNLKGLPAVSSVAYGGTPGQGHPDEKFINEVFADKHWTSFCGEGQQQCWIAESLGEDIVLLNAGSFALLLPALLLSAIQIESMDSQSRIGPQGSDISEFPQYLEEAFGFFCGRSRKLHVYLSSAYNFFQLAELALLIDEFASLREAFGGRSNLMDSCVQKAMRSAGR